MHGMASLLVLLSLHGVQDVHPIEPAAPSTAAAMQSPPCFSFFMQGNQRHLINACGRRMGATLQVTNIHNMHVENRQITVDGGKEYGNTFYVGDWDTRILAEWPA